MQIAAFFDMDHTVLLGSSGKLFLRYLMDNRLLTWRAGLRVAGQVALYIIGLRDFPHLINHLTYVSSGGSEQRAWELTAACFDALLRGRISDNARQRISWHQEQGHHVAIASAATPFFVQPVARALGLGDAFLATKLESSSGRLTGRLVPPSCYGAGKVLLVRRYAFEHDIDLGASYFYSDGYSDLPLLLAVGHPVAVNPDRRLRERAREERWPVESF